MRYFMPLVLVLFIGLCQGCGTTPKGEVAITFAEPVVASQESVTLPDGRVLHVPEPALWPAGVTRFAYPPGQATPMLEYVDAKGRKHVGRFFVTGSAASEKIDARFLEVTRYRQNGSKDVVSSYDMGTSPSSWPQYSDNGHYPVFEVVQSADNNGVARLIRVTVFGQDSYQVITPDGKILISDSSPK